MISIISAFQTRSKPYCDTMPDILMIGEIRDENSLDIALRASLTGHLVLSTIHANDFLSVIERLLDMGAKDYLVSSTLRLLISQRLVEKALALIVNLTLIPANV